jgi:hypothetical protein
MDDGCVHHNTEVLRQHNTLSDKEDTVLLEALNFVRILPEPSWAGIVTGQGQEAKHNAKLQIARSCDYVTSTT